MKDEGTSADRLWAMLHQVDDSGERRFSEAQIDDLTPLVFLTAGGATRFEDWPPDVRHVMSDFARRIKATGQMSAEDFNAALLTYYDAHPLCPDLVQTFRQFVRTELVGGLDMNAAAGFARLMGEKRNFRGDESVPDDALKAGPGLRFKLLDPDES